VRTPRLSVAAAASEIRLRSREELGPEARKPAERILVSQIAGLKRSAKDGGAIFYLLG
jgi:hypothetical protein